MLSKMQKEINELKALVSSGNKIHIQINEGNSFVVCADGGEKQYSPSKTCYEYHDSNKFIRLLMGAYGSGKSTASVAEIVFRACKMPVGADGKRRAKCVVIRNTSGELETTTLRTWLDWFGGLGVISHRKKPVLTYEHIFNDGKGEVILECLFLALDRDEDIRKLKSLECTFAYLNEASELPASVLEHIKSRVGRYPNKQLLNGEYWSGVIMDTNPPDTDHWIYKTFEVVRDENCEIFKQPPALLRDEDGKLIRNPNAENLSHLGQNYYLNMASGATEEFIKVYIFGDYGAVITGRLVYTQYNDDIHSAVSLSVDKDEPLLLSWDFGLTPACLVCQNVGGQLRIIKEYTTDRMGIVELAGDIVLPDIKAKYKNKLIGTCDPAGIKGVDTDTQNCIDILNNMGLETEPAETNVITARLDGVRAYLNKLISGKPAIIISREGCPNLRRGFLGKYSYKRIRLLNEERYRDLPDKTHPFSDIQDCLQYACLYYSIRTAKPLSKFNPKDYMLPTHQQWGF